jgi:hypothetical protein
MFKRLHSGIHWAGVKSWLAPAGLWGRGLLPCPGCGAPMILHYWPAALALTLFNLRRGKTSACAASRYDDTEAETVDCCSCSISEVMDES